MSGTLKPLFGWRSAIAGSDLRASVRHVALTLSLHMNEAGDSAFPSLVTLARETGLHKETVHKALGELGTAGFLQIRRTGGGRGRPNHYRASLPKGSVQPTDAVRARGLTSDDPDEGSAQPPVPERVGSAGGNGRIAAEKGSAHPTGGRTPEDVLEDVHPAAAPRPRDEIWDALEQIYGQVVHDADRDRRNRAVKLLRQASVSGAEVHELVRYALGHPEPWVRRLPATAISLATNAGEIRRLRSDGGSVQDEIARRLQEAAS